MQFGDRISHFMNRIAGGDRILLVISDKYLRSPYCMYELFKIYRNQGDNPEKFLNKVIPLVLPDTKIDTLSQRLAYAAYWKEEHDKVHEAIDKLGIAYYGVQTLSDYKSMQAFSQHTADMLAYISDKLVPRDFDRQAQDGFKEIVENITGK